MSVRVEEKFPFPHLLLLDLEDRRESLVDSNGLDFVFSFILKRTGSGR